jgi:serine/threonine protein phosphatase PrpC
VSQPIGAIDGATPSPASLQDHLILIRKMRQRGWKTHKVVLELLRRVVQALASEHAEQHMLLRFTPEDLLYERGSRTYRVAPEVKRYPLSTPPAKLSLLDNGIYAPEVTRQITRPLSPRTDVYSLAAVLYHLVSGQQPSSDLSRLADKLPPLRIFEPALPPGLDPVLRRALSRTPEGRQADVAELQQELERVLAQHARREATSVDAPLEIRLGVSSNTGIRKSEKNPVNQDMFFSAYEPSLSLGLLIVADGVSNCELGSGEKAAECVVEAGSALWQELLQDPESRQPPSWRDDGWFRARLGRMLQRANEEVCRKVSAAYPGPISPEARIMSSTAVAVLLNGRRAIVANLGDSRVYLVRPELIDQLTVDMNRRTTLLRRDQGLEAVVNTSGLGELVGHVGLGAVTDGVLRPQSVVPEVQVLNLLPGDRLVVCSDGVPDCIGREAESTIQRIVCGSPRPSQAAWDLVVAANQMGGEDNITAIVADCIGKEDEPWPTS